jgi:glycerol kinase
VGSFIPLEIDGTEDKVYVEVIPTGNQTGIQQRSKDKVTDKLTTEDFKRMIRQAVMPACQTFVDVWQELNQPMTAESAEVEFNVGFTASGSAVIMQASGQASFKVKVSWKFAQTSTGSGLRAKVLENLKNDLEELDSKIQVAQQIVKQSQEDNYKDKLEKLEIIQHSSAEIKKSLDI